MQFSTTDPGGTNTDYNNLYMAVSKGGCNGQFTNYPIYGKDPKAKKIEVKAGETVTVELKK